jgi:hypothetical protein
MRVRDIQRGRIKAFLGRQLDDQSRNTVRLMHATLRVVLNSAVDDGLLVANPADKLGRALKLVMRTKVRQEQIKAALHLVDCRALILTSLEGEAQSAPSSGPQSPSRQYRWPSLQQSRPEWSRPPCPYRSPGRSSRQSHRSRTCTKQPEMPTRSARTVRVDRVGFIFVSPHRDDTGIGRHR